MKLSRERRFTSDAAHELRTPLTAIKTHLQVARITHGKDAEEAMDYAQEGVARLQHTLSQLLTLSQVEGAFSWDDGGIADANEVARLAMRDAAPRGRSGGEIDAAEHSMMARTRRHQMLAPGRDLHG